MRGVFLFLCFNIFLISFLIEAESENNGVYIVYMGSSRNNHAQLLNSLMNKKKNNVIQSYSNGFSGFAARLSEKEAKSMAKRPGVVSVFPDRVLQLHTTRSWDFLRYESSLNIDSTPSSTLSDLSSNGADTIIGFLDTGIWPESESFTDEGMGPIPSRWKGKCMEGQKFTSFKCNRKVIGARYYDDPSSSTNIFETPRDQNGHGTHVASTAAGRRVSMASYYGLANGTAQGGSPSSRIAMYRVCTSEGCLGSSILKAFDDAIADGVDLLSLSLGSSPGVPDLTSDPISIGAFHAVEKGIIVICSAGNSGPSPSTVVNVAPWIMTVAGTTIDRDFEAHIMLGGNKVIKGGGINFSNLKKSPIYPLVDGSSARSNSNQYSEYDARNCLPGSLNGGDVKGKIVLCENTDDAYEPKDKFNKLKDQGAIGMIIIDNGQKQVPSKYGMFPIAAVSEQDGAKILSYIKTNSNPVGTILPTVTIQNNKPSPVVGYFSSRGPILGIENLLKPDITAPGVAVLAAWPSNDTSEALLDREPPFFNILSGTSMACPHVSGLAALVKSQHPIWSPSAIRSAIMTTAIHTNNLNVSDTTELGSRATPYDIGAGEINLLGPLQPGLVYETEIIDYIQFLCNIAYDTTQIKSIASTISSDIFCPNNTNTDLISNMNYPSIAISNLKENESKTVKRTVTNVGEEESIYTVIIDAPTGVEIKVVPDKLRFTKKSNKLTFQVTFKRIVFSQENVFGSITWSSEKYKVRSPCVVSNRSY